MPQPSKMVERFARRVFSDETEASAFLAAWSDGRSAAPAVLWMRDRPDPMPFGSLERAPWQPGPVDRISPDVRAGRTPEHEAGDFYCLDLSSVFATVPLQFLPTQPRSIVDVCASPGGKSLLAHRLLSPQRLVCNETIGKRVGALLSNLRRCGANNTWVTSQDPESLADCLEATSDLVIVDAPCSGQSLPARGIDNPGCFHETTIRHNSGRQRRIIAHSARIVAPGGWLLYSTCTYSREENGAVIEWLLRTVDGFDVVEVPILSDFASPTGGPGYQLWPQAGWGAGAYCCLLRRYGDGTRAAVYREQVPIVHALDD